MASRERVTLAVLATISLAMRVVAFFHYRFDSDEAQHLHVAWGWTAGLLQYRDLFDNHAPLLHISTAPMLSALGEREDILLYMRGPMIALFAIVIATSYVIARRLYSTRVAVWSAVLLSLMPPFFLKSLEYRNDNLWNALWCFTLLILTSNPLTNTGLFLAGLLLGCALATSMKTSLLLLTLAAAAVMTRVATRRTRNILPLIAGIPIVPAAVVAYFAFRGALPNLFYGAIRFNELLTRTRSPQELWLPRALWLPMMAIVLRVAWRHRPPPDDPRASDRFFLGFASAFFVATLICFWILVSPRDFLPVFPLLTIFAVAVIERHGRHAVLSYVAIAAVFIAAITYYADRFSNHTREQITMMHQLLRLTRPGDLVIDYKGETIYRRRPYYFILEFITRSAMHRSLIPDTIVEDVIRKRCYVAQADGDFWPDRSRAFLHDNFLDMGRLRASGKWIRVKIPFTVGVPGPYVVLDKRGEVHGMLDNVPYSGSRFLAAGPHIFHSDTKETIAVLWTSAYQRGFSPFHPQDRDF